MLMPYLLADTIEEKQARYDAVAAIEYQSRYLDGINAGKLDVTDDCIPPEIKNDARARIYFQAGFLRGVKSYSTVSGLKKCEGGGIHENFYSGVFYWELKGFLKGCATAYEFGQKLRYEIDEPVRMELKKIPFNPEMALDAAIKTLERIDDERNQDEQPGAGQPTPRPAEKIPAEVKPPPPPSEDAPK